MATCERLQTCPFFTDRMANMPAVANLMKQTYCFGDKMTCARYMVAVAGIAVPGDLLPNDGKRSRLLLEGRLPEAEL